MSDESHFIPEHVEQAAYMLARGRSWGVIAHDLNYPDPDRMRRAMYKEPTFSAMQKTARGELADECAAEGVSMLRTLIREKDYPNKLEAAKALIEFAEHEKARQHAWELEQFKASERARLQKERIAAAAEVLEKKLAAQVQVETARAQMRTALGLGLPATEKEKAKRNAEMIDSERRYWASATRATEYMASELARERESVWLPLKKMAGNGRAPDMSDQPFQLVAEHVEGRTVYWLDALPHSMMFAKNHVWLTNPDGSLVEDNAPPG
jgi:hypothetical protein